MGIEYGDGSSVGGPWREESGGVNERFSQRFIQSTCAVIGGVGNLVSVGPAGCDKLCCDWGQIRVEVEGGGCCCCKDALFEYEGCERRRSYSHGKRSESMIREGKFEAPVFTW